MSENPTPGMGGFPVAALVGVAIVLLCWAGYGVVADEQDTDAPIRLGYLAMFALALIAAGSAMGIWGRRAWAPWALSGAILLVPLLLVGQFACCLD